MDAKKNKEEKGNKETSGKKLEKEEKPGQMEDHDLDENRFDFGGLPDDSDLKKGLGCGG